METEERLGRQLRKGADVLRKELASMQEVLKDLNYVDGALQLQEKGKVACQINAVNELIVTEAVFRNLFAGASAELFAGALCAVTGERFAEER